MIDWSTERQVAIPPVSEHDEENIPASDWSSIGRIYEHLACYYLSSVGFKAEIKDAAGYDILCECPDGKFFKVEVKSSIGRINAACKGRSARTTKVHRFNGISKKAAADLFMFFERSSNFVVIKTRSEMGSLNTNCEISGYDFSEYNTNRHLSRIKAFSGSADNEYLFPTTEETLKLNRSWVKDNMDLVAEMKAKGVWTSTLSRILGIGDTHWIKRIQRQHRNSISGITK